ncbi:MAG TPA: hypothetical protein VJS85_11000, partial [Rhizomicrobium sp.]|nr:hypothetical protein [Rhizomicrobium sp.]
MDRLDYIAKHQTRLSVSGAPQGYDAYVAAQAARRRGGPVLFVALDDVQADAAERALQFFAPSLTVLSFPAWDCLPYDRVSPKPDIESRRLATLAALARDAGKPAVIVTTINAVLQRVPPKDVIAGASFAARNGAEVDREALVGFLSGNGYVRAGTVREPGDFALRGGIVDLWPPGEEMPLRLDFFGSTLDAIRRFDAETQLSDKSAVAEIALLPASEAPLNAAAVSRFRTGYVATFGAAGDDPLYESVSAGRKTQGMEHWLPLFYERLDTLFDYLPRCLVMLGHQAEKAKAARQDLIQDYYETREQFRHAKDEKHRSVGESRSDQSGVKGPPYKPLKPETLYLTDADWKAALAKQIVRELSPFQAPESTNSVDAGGRQGRDFAPERQKNSQGGNLNVFQAAADHLKALQAGGKRVLVASWTDGSVERMGGVLSDHGVTPIRKVCDWPEALKLDVSAFGIACLGIERGVEGPDFAILSEQDVLG